MRVTLFSFLCPNLYQILNFVIPKTTSVHERWFPQVLLYSRNPYYNISLRKVQLSLSHVLYIVLTGFFFKKIRKTLTFQGSISNAHLPL